MTPKQAKWYGEYIKDFNASRASRVCGSSEASAAVDGARMLRNANVSAAVEAWKARNLAKYEITAERVLDELYKLATYDAGNLYDFDGNRIPVHLLDDVTRAAVCDVEDETTEATKLEAKTGAAPEALKTVKRKQRIKLAEKGQNLERLGKYFGLFGDPELRLKMNPGPQGLPANSEITVTLVRAG
ncbi:terminase small subunit [Acidicapsa dinghuensis]|uniref:Terminase small subunit n=1 Tax=Acidicapsa dinghuensis TaxID=2218256 RepID=A0ABW1EB92_9BACT|nr:terminase small subunit [Acidicapsa dinghuensis]